MRTLWFLLAGFALLAVCLGLARVAGASLADPMRTATLVFLTLWFVVAGINLWVGVSKAGYTVAEELPIFLLIFGLPALVALLVKWKFF
jgi:hypothetical protein